MTVMDGEHPAECGERFQAIKTMHDIYKKTHWGPSN